MLQRVFVILLFGCINNIRTDGSIGSDLTDLNENYLKRWENEFYGRLFKDLPDENKVRIDLYYEVFCPYSISFITEQFGPVVETMSEFLHIYTYPYGNAHTIHENGTIHFKCQHGPAECYGNKLHACALQYLHHKTALLFNVCLMKGKNGGSDDSIADKCGHDMDIDSEEIKKCAKGELGDQLLNYYGELSKKAKLLFVPTILINDSLYLPDKELSGLKKAVCAAFAKNPPPPCST